jgi:hypothetical protein
MMCVVPTQVARAVPTTYMRVLSRERHARATSPASVEMGDAEKHDVAPFMF